jgi:hypothetical protein
MKNIIVISALLCTILLCNCTVIRPGQVGIKQKLGVLSSKSYSQGPIWYNPFTTKIIKIILNKFMDEYFICIELYFNTGYILIFIED